MCGVLGIVSRDRDVLEDALTLLNAQNNRGERACGGATFDGKRTHYYCGNDSVSKVFSEELS